MKNQRPFDLIEPAEKFILEHSGYNLSLAFKDIKTSFEIPETNIKIFDEDTYYFKKIEFEKTMFKNVDNGYYYEIDETEIKFRTRQKLIECFKHLSYKEEKGDEILNKSFITNWVKDATIRLYYYVELLPPPLICLKILLIFGLDTKSKKLK